GEHREQVTIALDSANILLDLINQILDFSKVEAGRLELEEVEFDLLQLVEGAAEMLAGEAREKRLLLMTFVDPKAPRVVRGDLSRLRQVLLNLMGNAIKFTEKGEVVVRVVAEEEQLKFTVTDTGVGIQPQLIDRLFEPFVQGDGTITRRYGG